MKTSITKAVAIESLLNAAAPNLEPEVIAKAEKMLAQLRKKREKVTSEAAIFNTETAQYISDNFSGEIINSKWVCEHVNGVLHPQKATYVISAGVKMGLFEKLPPKTKSGKSTYQVL